MKFWLASALGVLVLAGCASKQTLVPQVTQGVAADGAKTVAVAPEKVVCGTTAACPVLAASWTSAKAGQAVLTVGLPGQQAQVTGADFHFSGVDTVRLRLPSRGEAPALGYPAMAFDVPLRVVSQIAYTQRSWVRVHLAGGRTVDETINSGDQRGKAVESLSYFLAAVEASGGTGANAQRKGGLFEALGGDSK